MTAIDSPTRAPRRARASRRTALAAVVLAAGLLLTACGGDSGTPAGGGDGMDGMDHGGGARSASSAPAGSGPAPGAFNDADVMFAQMMIPHHEQALDMAELADGRAADAEIVELSDAIAAAQDPEIEKMTSWLKSWGKPASAHGVGGMDHGGDSAEGSGMSGMMSEKDLDRLKAAQGEEFDRLFAQMMIDHHRGAVEMAEDERKNGRNATAKKLAADVAATQSTEIDALERILDRL
ncbi:DUF305 domain-containing protein [Streptomyces sp. NPDC020141]|uniref:DUF305 domain-containing protein n=1 Tax=Streptomyces sp. NPDC020141 TaxID=3365065 RepID=UPI00378A792C